MAQYKVQDPQGQEHLIEGPEGATPEEIMTQAQSLVPDGSSFDTEKAKSNILPDVKQMISGLISHVSDSPGMDIASGNIPAALPKLFKQGTALMANPSENAAEMVRPLVHPIAYAEEHPVQQAMNVLGAGQLGMKGAGMALNAMPATENMLPTLQKIANNQTLKSMGGSIGQLKQMEEAGGRSALDNAAQFARDKGIADVFSTGIGRDKLVEKLLKNTGQKVGQLRTEAGPASPDILNKIISNPKSNIDTYLGEGLASEELPTVDKALADIKRIAGPNPTHADLAKAATYINEHAAGNKLYQPVTAATDVANALSDENNQGIAQTLGADKAKQYVSALEDQQKLHPIEHLQKRGELREAGGRGGIGMQLVQRLADEVGYRLSAKTISAIHDSLLSEGTPITQASVANKISTLSQPFPIAGMIQQLQQKYDQRRKM